MMTRMLIALGGAGALLALGAAQAETPPPLDGWPTVRIAITHPDQVATVRAEIRAMMNRHDFDYRGGGGDRVTYSRGRRFESRTYPEPVPGGDDVFGHTSSGDQNYTQVAFDYAANPDTGVLTIVARPIYYTITYSVTSEQQGREVKGTLVTTAEMKSADYARVLQRELELIEARLGNPPMPILYDDFKYY